MNSEVDRLRKIHAGNVRSLDSANADLAEAEREATADSWRRLCKIRESAESAVRESRAALREAEAQADLPNGYGTTQAASAHPCGCEDAPCCGCDYDGDPRTDSEIKEDYIAEMMAEDGDWS